MPIPGLTIEAESAVPVYRQIADGVRSAAKDGRLKPGHRLPATRDLARELGVNRQTVVTAYEHLQGEGWVESHTGRLQGPNPGGSRTPGGRHRYLIVAHLGDTHKAGRATAGKRDGVGKNLERKTLDSGHLEDDVLSATDEAEVAASEFRQENRHAQ